MKDRIVFFILGALLSTIAYMAGGIDLNAQTPFEKFDKLVVKDLVVERMLTVSQYSGTRVYDSKPSIMLQANGESASVVISSTTNPKSSKHGVIFINTKANGDPTILMQNSRGKNKLYRP